MKNQKGITLIALVITIIVLLILAGVSIAMLTGENGILTKATGANETSTAGEVDEAIKLAIDEILANKYDPTYTAPTGADAVATNVITVESLIARIPANNSNIVCAVEGTEPAKGKIAITVKAGTNTGDIAVEYKGKDYTHTWTITDEGKITKNDPTKNTTNS